VPAEIRNGAGNEELHSMPIHNADIAEIFEEIANFLELDNANPFRVRAYRNAARTIQELGQDARELVEKGADLNTLPGVGKELAAKIVEIVQTGHCQALEKLRRQSAPGLTDLLKIPGLGPKRVRALYHDLDIHTVEQLMRAAHDHRLRELPGFGEKTEAHILQSLQTHLKQDQRLKLAVAAQYAATLVDYLRLSSDVTDIVVAGSFRRC
jgi:DNA polymerase (family 10)